MTYTPPGVTVQELTSLSVSPIAAAPSVACVVGLSAGSIRRTDAITLNATTATPIPGLPAGATIVTGNILVTDSYTNPSAVPAGYNSSTGYGAAEYTLNTTNNTLARVSSGGSGTSGASLIPDGETVYLTYDYLPVDYFTAALYTDLASVEARYGQASDALGNIVSPLSYGAFMAFEGGANQVYAAPLFKLTSSADPSSVRLQPTASDNAASATWQQTLYALRDFDDINIIVPIVGQSQTSVTDAAMLSIFHEVQDHCYVQGLDNRYVLAILGEDSSTDATKATKSTIRSHADDLRARHGGLTAQDTILFNTSRFTRPASNPAGVIVIGAQYEAAALAGLLSSTPVSTSVTRSVLSGATVITDPRSKQDKIDDGAKGLLVVEDNTGVIVIRHAITLDTSSTANRQISVVRAKHKVIESVRTTLETRVIGKTIVSVNSADFVAAAVQGVLDQLVSNQDILGYGSIQARTLQGDPTTVEVRFDYRPAFALDYINIKFSLDLSSQTVSTS